MKTPRPQSAMRRSSCTNSRHRAPKETDKLAGWTLWQLWILAALPIEIGGDSIFYKLIEYYDYNIFDLDGTS